MNDLKEAFATKQALTVIRMNNNGACSSYNVKSSRIAVDDAVASRVFGFGCTFGFVQSSSSLTTGMMSLSGRSEYSRLT